MLEACRETVYIGSEAIAVVGGPSKLPLLLMAMANAIYTSCINFA